MPSRKTILACGYFYHIYNKAVADNLLFVDEQNYHFFISKIRKYLIEVGEILAYCLMPNHYHILMLLKEVSLPEAMQRFALAYSVPFNKRYNRTGHLFQGPYRLKHVDDTRYLVHLTRYIHLNPLTANLVNKAEEWEYSSLREYIGMDIPDFISPTIVLNIIDNNKGSSVTEKQKEYLRFIGDWDPAFMAFIQK